MDAGKARIPPGQELEVMRRLDMQAVRPGVWRAGQSG